MDIWVLGCGPSLSEVSIPPDVLTIGVNNSYKHHWSPVWAGGDLRALKRDYADIEDTDRPLIYFSSIDPKRVFVKVRPGRPLEFISRPERPNLRKGGTFAYWLACNVFKATRVHIIGFDMETNPKHFDGDKLSDWNYAPQRRNMKAIQKASGVESWIFIDGSWMPVAMLPATGKAFESGTYRERDITEGCVRPQDFDFGPYLDKFRRMNPPKKESNG